MGVSAKDISKLTGAQKVAIVLLSLSDSDATKVFSLMSEEEITEVSHAMSHLGSVSPEVIDSVMSQLNSDLVGDSVFLGNFRTTEKLLEKVLDKDRVGALMDEIKGPQGKNTWEKLTNVNEELLALYFRNEHPQTAALVLSKISPDHAAKVISNLPESFAFEVIARIVNLGKLGDSHHVENFLEMVRDASDTNDLFVFLSLSQNLDKNGNTAAIDICIAVKLQ